MQKPNNYSDTEAFSGGNTGLTPGGKILTITNAYETKFRSGLPALVLEIDIAEGSEAGYYRAANEKFGGEWRGIYRQGTTDANGGCNPWFKGMITAIEESNNGFVFDFDERSLIGLSCGGVFGEEEYVAKDGSVKTITKIAQIRSVDAILSGDFKVPAKKLLDPSKNVAAYSDVNPADIPF